MSTSHRGLPPPSAMPLPVPNANQTIGPLGDRWQYGSDETQRTWLQTKCEEEKRKQEEERTKQENFRLEIRKTELELLREAFRGGIPPQLVPIIFTGGGALAGTSAEWANQYISQLNQANHHLMHTHLSSNPESRNEGRLLTATDHSTPHSGTASSVSRSVGPNQIASNSHRPSTSGLSGGHPAAGYSPFSIPGLSPGMSTTPQIHTSEPPRSSLPRINTNEIHPQPPQPLQSRPPPAMQLSGIPPNPQSVPHHLASHQTSSDTTRQPETSPIFFHHWQPPSQPTASAPGLSGSPASGKTTEASLHHHDHRTQNEISQSPKRRKTAAVQFTPHSSAAPTPHIQHSSYSPSFSPGSNSNSNKRKGGIVSSHTRNRSDSGSTRGYEPYPKANMTRTKRPEQTVAFEGNGTTSSFSISQVTSQGDSPDPVHHDSEIHKKGSPMPNPTYREADGRPGDHSHVDRDHLV